MRVMITSNFQISSSLIEKKRSLNLSKIKLSINFFFTYRIFCLMIYC